MEASKEASPRSCQIHTGCTRWNSVDGCYMGTNMYIYCIVFYATSNQWDSLVQKVEASRKPLQGYDIQDFGPKLIKEASRSLPPT